ncbi:MAG TPA: hypothetical protein VE152_07890 [Acidimicrobiales bacterium]|jgi:cell division septum initiation protein DivIVA|nr:hypothetical protein [Acidimicrobiales bacterium]
MSAREDPDHPDSEVLLRQAVELVANARSMPLSNAALVSREEVLELLEDAVERLPEDLRRARWLLREREEHLAKARREAEEIVEAARVRAERMVQRSQIVRDAKHEADRLVEEAREEARRLRHDAEDYCDRRLGDFEVVLERVTRTVRAGRDKLRGTGPPEREDQARPSQEAAAAGEADDTVFDQDR